MILRKKQTNKQTKKKNEEDNQPIITDIIIATVE